MSEKRNPFILEAAETTETKSLKAKRHIFYKYIYILLLYIQYICIILYMTFTLYVHTHLGVVCVAMSIPVKRHSETNV